VAFLMAIAMAFASWAMCHHSNAQLAILGSHNRTFCPISAAMHNLGHSIPVIQGSPYRAINQLLLRQQQLLAGCTEVCGLQGTHRPKGLRATAVNVDTPHTLTPCTNHRKCRPHAPTPRTNHRKCRHPTCVDGMRRPPIAHSSAHLSVSLSVYLACRALASVANYAPFVATHAQLRFRSKAAPSTNRP
jgi:hypothetical protein